MVGPNGEKRPGDAIANALHVAKLATGEIEETYEHEGKHPGKRAAGQKGAAARADAPHPGAAQGDRPAGRGGALGQIAPRPLTWPIRAGTAMSCQITFRAAPFQRRPT